MELNRGLRDENGELYDVVAGAFLVVGLGDESFASPSPELIQKYTEQFKTPELFMQANGKIVSFSVPAPDVFTPASRVSGQSWWSAPITIPNGQKTVAIGVRKS